MFGPEIEQGRLEIIDGDALEIKWPQSITKVIANIPYQISSPLIDKAPSSSKIKSAWF